MSRRAGATTRSRIWTFDHDQRSSRRDVLGTEEPLEIRLSAGDERRTVAITMRTPGADFELAAGFLYAEGIVSQLADIRKISFCVDSLHGGGEQNYNVVTVELAASTLPDIGTLERHFSTTSACGVCGKASVDAIQLARCPVLDPGPAIAPALIRQLPPALHDEQSGFVATGGLHAAALFDAQGTLLALREDVGRHNALDKLMGWALMQRKLPLRQSVVLVSGRASFELVQKCLMAEVPVLCAISAPSSLAVDLARRFGMTLVGFLRGERFNVYSGLERISVDPGPASSDPEIRR